MKRIILSLLIVLVLSFGVSGDVIQNWGNENTANITVITEGGTKEALLIVPLEVTNSSVSSPELSIVDITVEGLVYSNVLSSGTTKLFIQARDVSVPLKLSYTVSGIGSGEYISIFSYAFYWEDNINFDGTIYLSGATTEVEILSWR